MVVRTIEVLLEYVAIILCIHKIVNIKFHLNKWNILLGGIDYGVMLLVSYEIVSPYVRFIIYALIIIYAKLITKGSWNKAISIFGSVMITTVSLQFIVFYGLKLLFEEAIIGNPGSIVNFIICTLCCIWKQEYFNTVIKWLNAVKGIIISLLYGLIFVQIVYLGEQKGNLPMELVIQFLVETIGLSIVALLWIGAEIKNKQKMREVQMYETYNQAFEETIMTIRARQHEFENHINTLRCLQYTIKDKDELLKTQNQYYSSILQDTSVNHLLKLHLNPVLMGFLYSKGVVAKEKGISVKYDIQQVEINKNILVYEVIEVIGILFDNALEAVELEEDKKVIIKIKKDNIYLWLEVANKSRLFHNYEIEKFMKSGYSTKGKDRGVGLVRVKDIAKKYKAIFEVGNHIYDNDNYLRFVMKIEN